MAGPAVIGPGGRAQNPGAQNPRAQTPRPLLRTVLGGVLRRIRREQGRTLADVARAARVSMPYLSELERGRKEASSEVLAAICDALRVELADLLAEVGFQLAGQQARQATVIRLTAIAGGQFPASRPGPRPGQAQCLLAA